MNDVGRRLRDVERRALKLPPGADPLQTFEDGSPLGDTRSLDFGAGINATLIGDDYVRVTGAAGGGGPWDAILDSSVTVTDTDSSPPVFKSNVREAVTYLDALGYTRANIFVRPGTYTETAGWTNTNVLETALFSPSSTYAGQVTWDHAGFTVGSGKYVVQGVHAVAGVKATFFPGELTMLHCGLDGASLTTPFRLTASDSFLYDCVSSNHAMRFGNRATLIGGQIRVLNRSVTLADTWILMDGCVLGESQSATWTLPSRCYLNFSVDSSLRFGTADAGILTLSGASAGGTYFIQSRSLRTRISVSISGGPEQVQLFGNYQSITVGAPQDPQVLGSRPHYLDVTVNDDLDLTGPALLDYGGAGSETSLIQLRGNAIKGAITRQDFGASGGMVEFINADNCEVNIAGYATGGGTRKPLTFDASSSNNVVVLAGRSTFGAAYTDAGTNNRVLPEGSAPPAGGIAPANADYLVGTANAELSGEIVVGTTPGGELGGTWGSPTVDTIHSGSAHADFIAKAFFAAKGDLIGASANDTPIILTVGTDNFVLVADSTTASGLAWKNITALLNPDSGWGSITNVTPDKVYDADATTVDELADVLGTLIATLVTKGYLSA